jgi:hypothetical protein
MVGPTVRIARHMPIFGIEKMQRSNRAAAIQLQTILTAFSHFGIVSTELPYRTLGN